MKSFLRARKWESSRSNPDSYTPEVGIDTQGTSLYCTSVYCTLQILCFSVIEGLWQPCIEQVYQHHFSKAFAHFVSPCHISVIQNISYFLNIVRRRQCNPLQYSCLGNPMDGGAWWATVHVVSKSRTGLSNFTFTFHFHALEKEMATHSSVLAWRIPGTEEPGGLQSMGSQRVGHN